MNKGSDKGPKKSKPISIFEDAPERNENVTKDYKDDRSRNILDISMASSRIQSHALFPAASLLLHSLWRFRPKRVLQQQRRIDEFRRGHAHGDLELLGASDPEISFMIALETGATEGDTPFVNETETLATKN